jgi:hypothetical protein
VGERTPPEVQIFTWSAPAIINLLVALRHASTKGQSGLSLAFLDPGSLKGVGLTAIDEDRHFIIRAEMR